MNKFFVLLLAVFVIAVGVFVYQQGSEEVSFFKDLFRLQSATSTTATSSQGPLFSYGYSFPDSGSSTGTLIGTSPATKDIPKGFTSKQLSPYFKQVKISNVVARGNNGLFQSIVLRSSVTESQGVAVDGWTLKSNRGGVVIPKAVRILSTVLPNQPGSLILKNNESVKLYSNSAPLRVSFRLNKCTGYLSTEPLLIPPPPRQCPPAARSDIYTFTGACQDYIMSLRACEIPSRTAPIPQDDFGCRNYLATVTYEGCVNRHRTDSDFLSSEWWAWIGRQFLDETHDRLLLFDKKGLLVDEFVY